MDRALRPRIASLALAVFVLGLAFPTAEAARRGKRRLIGRPAPPIRGDFALNGKPVTLTNLRGKVVLVDFWGVDCPHCIAAFPHLRIWNKKYKKKGLEIVGLTGLDEVKEPAMFKKLAVRHKLKHLLMTMPKPKIEKIWKAYHVSEIPHVVLIDRQGVVRMVKIGSGPEHVRALEKKIKKLLAERV